MKTYSSLKIERTILLGFLSVITAGAFFIWVFGMLWGDPISFLDAFFTSTSATCVTGLIVTDTALLPFPSQLTLLVLMQLGGLGVMTVTTAIFVFMRKRIGIHEGLYVAGGLNHDTPSGARLLVLRVWKIALLIEVIGGLLLYRGFADRFSTGDALWYAVFHSVSAFCNAGFSTFSDGLLSFSNGFIVPGTTMFLIVCGGMGFLVLHELWCFIRSPKRLSPHTVLVLRMTLLLSLGGAILYLISEKDASLGALSSWGLKLWNALFMSITSRTAGFNTVPMGTMSGFGAFLIICLMIIGASPGSTGGGIKTTTFGLLWLSTFNIMKGEERIIFRKRTISQDSALFALTVSMLYLSAIFLGTIFLRLLEPHSFRELLFEATSAMGTVGLSLDLTGKLGNPSKVVLIMLMFLGRVGVLTFVYGFAGRKRGAGNVEYPEAGIPVG